MNDNGSCLLRIRETLHALSPKEQQLARFILDQPEIAVDMQIEELAAACSVSVSTVIRMCKSLSYAGYKEFCRALYSDLAPSREESRFEDIHPGDEPDTVMRNICLSSIQAIEQTMAAANQSFILADHTKFGRVFLARVDAVCDYLITDSRQSNFQYDALNEQTTVVFADERQEA